MILRSGNARLVASPLGATLTEFQINKRQVIFPQQRVMIDGKSKLRGGVPLPFPWFGPHRDPNLPQHGFLRDTPFHEVKRIAGDEVSMTTRYAGSKSYFPWHFEAAVGFKLYESGFNQSVTIQHLAGKKHMPINPGFHPYFVMPQGVAEVTFPDAQQSFTIDKPGKSSILQFNPAHVVITIPGLGIVTMEADFAGWTVIWTDFLHYLCVEPILMHPKQYETSAGLSLAENATYRYEMSVRVELE